MILISFLFGLICNEYSWVDRLWSILPALYAWILAVRAWPDPRLIAGAALVTLWAARLTFNFARKGGYSGMEDYRWAEVRKFIGNEFLWQAFNFGFISTYQNALFVLFVLPLYMAYLFKGTPFGIIDIAASVFFLGFLVLETIADQQQWDFHAKKKNGTTDKRFLDEGLFGFSRHPNYFAEIMIWWCVYLFGAAATGKWIDWSVIGMVLLTLLFQGSTWLTEMLSMRKYPEYAEYRKRVSRIVPWFPKKASFSDETESGKV
ncbi:MAG: hypothetical protein A2Y33_10315 [Spirochaetes bacterium GWF1_51_8]|nr:MAG: hypothetical protein A2Y33_10315 [Spirochaetes bacterium GWF1_51_8]